MQPQEPSVSPAPNSPSPYPAPTTPNPSPDYSFLDPQPKKRLRLSLPTNSLKGRLFVTIGGAVLLIILGLFVKGLITSPALNQADFTILLKRQQEIQHILTVDVNTQTANQLTTANQNFVATASASLETAQLKTTSLVAAYKIKISSSAITKFYNVSIDTQFTNSLSTNSFNSLFTSEMQQQLGYYEQELTNTYAVTHVANARSLLKSEYSEARLLLKALSTPTS